MMESYTITKLNEEIKEMIQKDSSKNKNISVIGEISNLKISGKHTYMTLKDDSASIMTAFWNKQLDNLFKNGDNVEIIGKIDFHVKSGNINLIGYGIKNIGIGQLHKEYELLYKKYEQLGYYNNKKQLPTYIKNIGIITASEGAALQDFLYVVNNNSFRGNIHIYNCSVQGVKCPSSVADGIQYFNKNNKDLDLDIIVVTRGGGSFEDLMGYSTALVIEAIYKSKIYTISAIGHEVDNMISDFVANYRAPTPSIAAEVICKIHNEYQGKLSKFKDNLVSIKLGVEYKLKSECNKIQTLMKDIDHPIDSIDKKLEIYNDSIKRNINYIFDRYRNRIFSFKNKIPDPSSLLTSSLTIFENKINFNIKSIIDVKYKKIIEIKNTIVSPVSLLDDKIKYIEKNITSNIHSIFDKYNNRLKQIISLLEKNDYDYILDKGFVLLTDSDNNIVMDINNIINNKKKLKIIHSTGTYDIYIKKSD